MAQPQADVFGTDAYHRMRGIINPDIRELEHYKRLSDTVGISNLVGRVLSLEKSPIVEESGTCDFGMVEAAFNKYVSTGGKGGSDSLFDNIFQSLRLGGGQMRRATSDFDVFQLSGELIKRQVCRKFDFYTSLVLLGSHYFRIPPYLQEPVENFTYSCKYALFTNIKDESCLATASYQYSVEGTVPWFAEEPPSVRSRVRLSQGTPNDSAFNKKFLEVARGCDYKIEDVASALGLARRPGGGDVGDVTPIVSAMRRLGPCSLLTRFVKGWSYLISHSMHPIKHWQAALPGNVPQAMRYDMDTIRTLCTDESITSVINTTGMTAGEAGALAACFAEFPPANFPSEETHLVYGGKMIPGECHSGAYRIVGIGPGPFTADDMYSAMCKYASRMGKQDEFCDALPLACVLFSSHGLPSMSLPRPQGSLDIFSAALITTGDKTLVPPRHPNNHLIMGGLVVTRQIVLMMYDLLESSKTCDSSRIVSVLAPNANMRSKIYSLFRDTRFSDAFNVCSILDPLNISSEDGWSSILRIPHGCVSWAATRRSTLLENTQSMYQRRGLWERQDMIPSMTRKSSNHAKSTYYANSMLTDPQVEGSKVIGDFETNSVYRAAVSFLRPGMSSTVPVELTYHEEWTAERPRTQWSKVVDTPRELCRAKPQMVMPHQIRLATSTVYNSPRTKPPCASHHRRGASAHREEVVITAPPTRAPTPVPFVTPNVLPLLEVGSPPNTVASGDQLVVETPSLTPCPPMIPPGDVYLGDLPTTQEGLDPKVMTLTGRQMLSSYLSSLIASHSVSSSALLCYLVRPTTPKAIRCAVANHLNVGKVDKPMLSPWRDTVLYLYKHHPETKAWCDLHMSTPPESRAFEQFISSWGFYPMKIYLGEVPDELNGFSLKGAISGITKRCHFEVDVKIVKAADFVPLKSKRIEWGMFCDMVHTSNPVLACSLRAMMIEKGTEYITDSNKISGGYSTRTVELLASLLRDRDESSGSGGSLSVE